MATLALAGVFLAIGCGDESGTLDRTPEELPSNPVAPSRAPLAIPSTGSGGGEALARVELDPFSLPADFHAASGPLTPSTTTLPVDETYGGGAGWAFKITQEGSGNAGWFRITSPTSMNRMALLATHTGEGIAARAINTGRGRALWAQIPDPANPFPSLVATHVGDGAAVFGLNVGQGPAGLFEVRNPSGESPALEILSDGREPALRVASESDLGIDVLSEDRGVRIRAVDEALSVTRAFGGGVSNLATFRQETSPGAISQRVVIRHDGQLLVSSGSIFGGGQFVAREATNHVLAVIGGEAFDASDDAIVRASKATGVASGAAGRFETDLGEGLQVEQGGMDNAPLVRVRAAQESGDFTVYEVGTDGRIRFDRTGKGFFDGGTQTGGADIAESFDVEGPLLRYEPGDVLVISTARDRRVERSAEPYSTRVIGVYATKPGVLLSDEDIDAPEWGRVPVGVVGVVPTRVTAENGPIGRGDLLVTSSRPGHAMRADHERVRVGQVLGKALQAFDGSGSGLIEVMVNVK